MDLQAVADKLEIHELLARYARAVDDHDWDLYRSLFTEDASIDYSSAGAAAGSRDEVASFLAQAIPTLPWTQHVVTNVEIELDGDLANVRATFLNPMQLPGQEGPSCCGGSYRHEMVRTPDGWRSRRLIEENRWFVNAPSMGADD
jgi:3-phenylpropionate/cinnamic acid dioxygenase small subunit